MPIDIQKIKEDLENMSGLPFTVIKPRYGTKEKPIENKLKLLSWPPTGGKLAQRVLKHFALGGDGKQQAICPKTSGAANECPICKWIEASSRADDPTLIDRIKRIRQQERFMQLCIDWSHFENEKDDSKRMRVGIYDCSPKVHRSIMQETASQEYDFTDWTSALVSLNCYDQGPAVPKAIEFKVTMMQGFKPQVVELDPKDWLPLVPDLDTICKCPTPAELQTLLTGKEPEEEEEEVVVQADSSDKAEVEAPDEQPQVEQTPKLSNRPKEPPKEATAAAPKQKMSLADLVAKAKAASAGKK